MTQSTIGKESIEPMEDTTLSVELFYPMFLLLAFTTQSTTKDGWFSPKSPNAVSAVIANTDAES